MPSRCPPLLAIPLTWTCKLSPGLSPAPQQDSKCLSCTFAQSTTPSPSFPPIPHKVPAPVLFPTQKKGLFSPKRLTASTSAALRLQHKSPYLCTLAKLTPKHFRSSQALCNPSRGHGFPQNYIPPTERKPVPLLVQPNQQITPKLF